MGPSWSEGTVSALDRQTALQLGFRAEFPGREKPLRMRNQGCLLPLSLTSWDIVGQTIQFCTFEMATKSDGHLLISLAYILRGERPPPQMEISVVLVMVFQP